MPISVMTAVQNKVITLMEFLTSMVILSNFIFLVNLGRLGNFKIKKTLFVFTYLFRWHHEGFLQFAGFFLVFSPLKKQFRRVCMY